MAQTQYACEVLQKKYKSENGDKTAVVLNNEELLLPLLYNLPDNVILIPSYHPSPRNVNTKLVSQKMMIDLIRKAKKLSTA